MTGSTLHDPPAAPSAWGRWLGHAGGFFLGAVLLVAAWAKALDPLGFAREIESQGLDFLLSGHALALLALALEVGLGAALVLGIRRLPVLAAAAALVVFFVFLTGRTYWRSAHGELPADAGCGCFGNLVERTPAEAFWQDLALMVPALLLAWLGRPGARRWLGPRLGVVAVLTAAGLLLAWKAPELPLDDLATRLKPGVRVAEVCIGDPDDGSQVCLDTVLPEITEGTQLVILGDLASPALGDEVPRLNEYRRTGRGPRLWLLAGGATQAQLFNFQFGYGPAFEVRPAPPALLRPLYRTLPRSFLVEDGVVVQTWAGWPPLAELAATDGHP